VVIGGMPSIPGNTAFEKRTYIMENMDSIRKLLLLEPRGYPCQNANIIFPSNNPKAAFLVVIMEQNKIYPAMSGHNMICVATALLESGMLPMKEPITEFGLEAPSGLISIRAECHKGKVTRVYLKNAPSFVAHLDLEVTVPELGKVRVDVAFGGMWYAIVNAASVGLELIPKMGKQIVRLGEMIKVATREQYPVKHPLINYPGCDIMAFRGPPSKGSKAHFSNAVVMSNNDLDWNAPETWTGMIDRSPCGTGTCAIMATMYARGELKLNQEFIHDSIIGSTFVGKLLDTAQVGPYQGVVAEIAGQAWITQHCQVVVHPTDPFPDGYTVGDIWA